MNILQINSTVNTGSTGRIAEGIGRRLQASGHQSTIAYGRQNNPSDLTTTQIGNVWDVYTHGIKSLLLDRHGFGSKRATLDFIKYIRTLQPDAIGLHNMHGYYMHIGILFNELKNLDVPIIWTLFDCWAYTGHCTYYDDVGCEKWKTECHQCPKTRYYPASYLLDQSKRNFYDKKRLFHLPDNLHLVVHSKWLKTQVEHSFLNDLPLHHIYNGTDLNTFKPGVSHENDKKLILGVANTWNERKGLKDFIRLQQFLSNDFWIVLMGLSKRQIRKLPEGIEGIERTENVEELADWYRLATVFVNPTYQDNFPTTNIEALACGTPVITYNTGGSPEAIDKITGRVVEKGDIQGLMRDIKELSNQDQETLSIACRQRAERLFNQKDRYQEYVELYETLVKENQTYNKSK